MYEHWGTDLYCSLSIYGDLFKQKKPATKSLTEKRAAHTTDTLNIMALVFFRRGLKYLTNYFTQVPASEYGVNL